MIEQLTPRDKEIVILLLQGCTNGEIAKELNVSERTIKAHFNKMFQIYYITSGIKRVKLAVLFYRKQLEKGSMGM